MCLRANCLGCDVLSIFTVFFFKAAVYYFKLEAEVEEFEDRFTRFRKQKKYGREKMFHMIFWRFSEVEDLERVKTEKAVRLKEAETGI